MKKKWYLRWIPKMCRSTILGQLPILLVLLFVVSFLPQAWGQKVPSPQAPKLVVPQKDFNFKEVEEGKPIIHSFKILNRGAEPLKIIKVRPG